MLKSRRTFLQGAAALLASLPFAGQLFASAPPAQPKTPLLPPRTISEILTHAQHLYMSNGEWCRRCRLVAGDAIEQLNYRPLPSASYPAIYSAIIDLFVYGNSFPYQRLDGVVGLNAPHDIDLRHIDGRVEVTNRCFPTALFARRDIAHIRLNNYICGIQTIGWGIPPYFDTEHQHMPTVGELQARFDMYGKPALQRFIDRLS